MRNEVLTESNLLFEEEVHLTQINSYGFSWEQFAVKGEPIPAEGARFDIHFEGNVTGDALQGTITGVDYLTVRADGRLILDLHATITTDDGAHIKVEESGINDNGSLRLTMNFHTCDSRYQWLNHKQVWGVGTVNFETGQVKIKGFQH